MKQSFVLLWLFAAALVGCNAPKSVTTTSSKKALQLPAFNKEGHRGIRGLMPENTIPSMWRAMDFDVNTVELDIVISGDKQVVVSHDIYFHPDISSDPQGKHIGAKDAQNHLLYKMTYDSIRKYDVGLKPHKDFPQQQKVPAYKPLFADLIDAVDAYARTKGKKIIYNIEIKANPEWDNVKQPAIAETVDLLMAIVAEKKLEGRSYIQSFDFRPMQIIHQKYPHMTTAILIGGNEKRSLEDQLKALGYIPEMYSPAFARVTPELVKDCHKSGMKIIPWTVNTLEDMKRLKAMGVDGIITDYANYFSEL
jgi:glycerophosphoryl diester phosphodiesterase